VKTISVYDAVKLATKGPFAVSFGLELRGEKGNGDSVADCTDDYSASRGRMNATLLAHFFNHGPDLLAMLEEFVKLQEPFRKQLDANETEILDESIALIAKASKVEIEE
jgi:hypothetical protein